MDIREYRRENGLTQTAFAQEINKVFGANYTKAIVSYAEKGIVSFPQTVYDYMNAKIAEKGVRTCSDARNGEDRVIIPPTEKKSLKTAILQNWRAKGLTQNERILGYIDEYGSITSKEAFEEIGITRLASRIHDLTEMGYEFDKQTESSPNRFGKAAHYTRYRLKDDGTENMD